MAFTVREKAERRLTGLKAMREPYEATWREIARLTKPSRSRFLAVNQTGRFTRRNPGIYNSHPTVAFRYLAGGMTSGLSSPSRPWFKLATGGLGMDDDPEVKVWIGDVEKLMYSFFASTNFYGAVRGGYEELGLFGTEACVMVEHAEVGAVCHQLTAGEFFIGIGDEAIPDVLYRNVPMSVSQAVGQFGAKCSPRIRNLYDQARYDELCSFVHAIEENDEREPGVMTARGKPWRSLWWDQQDGDPITGMLSLSGYEEKPFWAPRWEVSGGDAYGAGPAEEALPDMRELQLQTKRKTDATAFLVKPEKIVPSGIRLTGEAGNTVAAARPDASTVVVPYQMPYQTIAAIMGDIERCTNAVDRLAYADLFMAITNMNGVQPRNVEEIASRNEEKLTQLGPVIERVNNEKLAPAIDRVFGIMSRRQMLPPAPKALQGHPLKVDFVSILAQAQRMIGIGQIERTVAFIGNLAAAFPEARDKLDVDKTVDEYADRAGAPARIFRTPDEIASIRQARAQEEQQQKMAAMAPAVRDGADAARLLAEAHANGGGVDPSMMPSL